jgi:hypothetical protein
VLPRSRRAGCGISGRLTGRARLWVAVTAWWCCSAVAQEANPITKFIHDALTKNSKDMIVDAARMPADKYDFKGPPDQVTFGYLVYHIADGNYLFCSMIGGVPLPKLPELSDSDAKDKLVERIKASFDFCTSALARLDDSHMSDTLTMGGYTTSRAMAILTLSGSWTTHLAQQEDYLQLSGSSRPAAAARK